MRTAEQQIKFRKRNTIIFAVFLAAAIICLAASVIKTNAFNAAKHKMLFSGAELFSGESTSAKDVTVVGAARSSTWSKLFDLNNEGLTENNYQAYTYDFTV